MISRPCNFFVLTPKRLISLRHLLPIVAKYVPWSAIDRALRQSLTREGMPFTVLPPDLDAINAFADALE